MLGRGRRGNVRISLVKKQTLPVCFFFIKFENQDTLFCVFALSNGVKRKKVSDKPIEDHRHLFLINL